MYSDTGSRMLISDRFFYIFFTGIVNQVPKLKSDLLIALSQKHELPR